MIRWASLLLLLSAGLGAGCAHTKAECVQHGGEEWREVTSAHFVVRTNLDSEAAKEATLELERSRKSLLFAFRNQQDPPGQLNAIILRSRHQLAEFTERADGFMTRDGQGPFIVMAGQSYLADASPHRQLVMHELAHYLTSYFLVRQPLWFAEGLASYLETTRPYGTEGEVRMGEAEYHLLYRVKNYARVPFEDLWKWRTSLDMSQADAAAHYSTAWIWVHFLINKHERELRDFQQQLAQAVEPRQAWNTAFGRLPQDELERELREYIKHGTYNAFRYKVEGVPTEVTERPLTAAQVHALRARLASISYDAEQGAREKKAEEELAAALVLDPRNADALEQRAQRAKDKATRLALARELVELHPQSANGWALLAAQLTDDAAAATERREALVKAQQLAPSDALALNNLAWDYVQTGQPKVALALAARAVRLAPWSAAVLDTWAAALAGSGKCREALVAQKRALEVLHERTPEAERKPYSDRLAQYEGGCKVAEAAAN